MSKRISHVIGIDDAPFAPDFHGAVTLVGAVFAGARLEGVLRGSVRRDGVNSTRVMVELVRLCRFREHLQAVMLQGIAVAGFNVVDINRLQRELELPVIVVSRRQPDMDAVRRALLEKVPGGRRKWRLVQEAGPPTEAAGVWIQRAGISHKKAQELVSRLAMHGRIPEPLRSAHLIASAFAAEGSGQRV